LAAVKDNEEKTYFKKSRTLPLRRNSHVSIPFRRINIFNLKKAFTAEYAEER
jgi:hypothetical protein